ncbi:MAG: hypothetical protein WD512_08430 [Candidatus Paceibacterota bacterium]
MQKKSNEEELSRIYEERRNPNIIHKFSPYAFIDRKLVVDFKNGKPCNARHHGIILDDGGCSFTKRNPDDIGYPINSVEEFNHILKNYSIFTLRLQHINDGAINIDEVKVFAKDGTLIADLTNYIPID